MKFDKNSCYCDCIEDSAICYYCYDKLYDKLKKERDELKARVEELENAMLDYVDA